MNNLMTFEQWRLIAVAMITPILGYYAPLSTFMEALGVMWTFSVIAGMRADGVTIIRCKNFQLKKFRRALWELFLYLAIMILIYTFVERLNERDLGVKLNKYLTIVFGYVYLQHGFKNLIIAYPKKVALRIVYHAIRLEFARMLPDYWKPIMEKIKNDERLTDNEPKDGQK